MVAKMLNTKCFSVWWCLYVLSNTQASLEALFIKKISKIEADLKKSLAYKKSVYYTSVTSSSVLFVK